MQLSVILINHNTQAITKQTIESILNTLKQVEYEIVVIDNSSDESEVIDFSNEKVRIFKGIKNNGFGHACNIGSKEAKGEYLLFLNSDTILNDCTVDEVFYYLKNHHDIGVIGVRQLLPNGTLDAGCKRGFPTPMSSIYYFSGISKRYPNSKRFGAYQQTFIDEHDIADVDCISGAFMMMSKEVFYCVGGFDENFFMYSEDVDFCYRLKQKGFRVVYYGKVSFTHLKGKSGIDDPFVLENFYKSMQIFYDKHYKDKYNFVVNWLVSLGIKTKYRFAKRALKKRLVQNSG